MSEIRSQATPARDELAALILTEPNSWRLNRDNLADRIIASGWSKPRTVNSAAELKAEPDGTILRDEDGMVGVVSSDGSGFRYVLAVGDPRPYTFASWAVSPSAVLFTPGEAG